MLTEQTEKRVISFVRSVANDCTTCMRRCKANCDHCRAQWANSIMKDVEAEMGQEIVDYGLVSRISQIMLQLKSANRPMLSKEIDVGGVCSYQLKLWTLKRMIRMGHIGRKIAHRKGRDKYFYFVKDGDLTRPSAGTRDNG